MNVPETTMRPVQAVSGTGPINKFLKLLDKSETFASTLVATVRQKLGDFQQKNLTSTRCCKILGGFGGAQKLFI